jgi:hypothetical protein
VLEQEKMCGKLTEYYILILKEQSRLQEKDNRLLSFDTARVT